MKAKKNIKVRRENIMEKLTEEDVRKEQKFIDEFIFSLISFISIKEY